MGAVFRATDRLAGERVALKRVLTPANQLLMDSASGGLRLRMSLAKEFQTLATLRHPHIISVLDYGFDDKRRPYYTMTLLDEPMTIIQAAHGRSLNYKVHLLVQTLQALAYLHRRGILHRDVKPANVLVHNQEIRVLDFGLAVQRDGDQAGGGTVAYMAPEILRKERGSEASDLYAVGVIAYHMLAGRHPYETENMRTLIDAILYEPPDLSRLVHEHDQPNASSLPDDITDSATTVLLGTQISDYDEERVPGEQWLSADSPLVKVIARLLDKLPERRFQSAEEVIEALCGAVGEPAPVETAAIRDSYLQAAAFVGREIELEQLEKALLNLKESEEPAGTAWLVGGESGVGKSRLMEELRIRALVLGVLVLRGQAVSEGGSPFHMWRQPLRRLSLMTELDEVDAGLLKHLVSDIEVLLEREIPDVPEVEPEAAQQRLLTLIASIFHRLEQPILLILEDLHWARPESLALTRQICRMVSDLPLLVIGTYRDDEAVTLADELRSMRLIRLERLSEGDVATLCESMLGATGSHEAIIKRLYGETEGNVFFLVEVVRALAEEAGQLDKIGEIELPEHILVGGVQRIVERRLERVPEAGHAMLRLAAVLGRELDFNVLRTIDPTCNVDQWLTECVNAAVIDIHDGRWRFAHDKLREGVLDRIPEQERGELHRKAAEGIEQVYPDSSVHAAALAVHWRMAGVPEKERPYAIQAAEQAHQISEFADAAALFERALELTGEEEASKRTWLHWNLGKVYSGMSQHETALAYLEKSIEIAKSTHDQVALGRAINGLGRVALSQGDYKTAAEHFEQSLRLARQMKDQRSVADACINLGIVFESLGEREPARSYLEEGLAISEKLKDALGIGNAHNNLGILAQGEGDYQAARQNYEEALKVYRQLGYRFGLCLGLVNLGSVLVDLGELPEAENRYQEGLKRFKEIGHHMGAAITINNMGTVSELLGRLDEAAERFNEYLQRAQAFNDQHGVAVALNNLGRIERKQGKVIAAQQKFERSIVIRQETGDHRGVALVRCGVGRARLAQGEPGAARRDFRQALQEAMAVNALQVVLDALIGLAEVHEAYGEYERAVELLAMVKVHPQVNSDLSNEAQTVLERINLLANFDLVMTALERGEELKFEEEMERLHNMYMTSHSQEHNQNNT
jgi:tetratricopeptide (TPR) repeat protein